MAAGSSLALCLAAAVPGVTVWLGNGSRLRSQTPELLSNDISLLVERP